MQLFGGFSDDHGNGKENFAWEHFCFVKKQENKNNIWILNYHKWKLEISLIRRESIGSTVSIIHVLSHRFNLFLRSELRDQGLTRPKVLILVPFRDAALKVVEVLIQLISSGEGVRYSLFIALPTPSQTKMFAREG